MPVGARARDLRFSKQADLTTAPGPPPCSWPIDMIDNCLSIAIIVDIMTHL